MNKRAIKKFIKTIDSSIKVKFQKGRMECDPEREIVYIGKTRNEAEDKMFADFLKEIAPDCPYNSFIMGILHEIGHIMTYTDELDEDREEQYALLQTAHHFGLYDTAELNREYFKIPMELEATQWGIDFAMAYPEFMKQYVDVIK